MINITVKYLMLAACNALCLRIDMNHINSNELYIKLTNSCDCKVNCKPSLEMEVKPGDWIQVLENISFERNPKYGFSTPLVPLLASGKHFNLYFPHNISKIYKKNKFRVALTYKFYDDSETSKKYSDNFYFYK
jgi:hypothetical protein